MESLTVQSKLGMRNVTVNFYDNVANAEDASVTLQRRGGRIFFRDAWIGAFSRVASTLYAATDLYACVRVEELLSAFFSRYDTSPRRTWSHSPSVATPQKPV